MYLSPDLMSLSNQLATTGRATLAQADITFIYFIYIYLPLITRPEIWSSVLPGSQHILKSILFSASSTRSKRER